MRCILGTVPWWKEQPAWEASPGSSALMAWRQNWAGPSCFNFHTFSSIVLYLRGCVPAFLRCNSSRWYSLWTMHTQESGPKANAIVCMLHICVLISHVCQDHAVQILMLAGSSQRASARWSDTILRMLCCRLDAETAIGRTAAASQSAVRLVSGLRRICAAPAHHPFCCRAPA